MHLDTLKLYLAPIIVSDHKQTEILTCFALFWVSGKERVAAWYLFIILSKQTQAIAQSYTFINTSVIFFLISENRFFK